MVRKNVVNLYCVAIVCIQWVLLMLNVCRLNDTQIEGLYFNTDYLYLASLYQDVWVEGQSIRHWHLTPAPYFFPDMLLYALIRCITGSIQYSAIIYAFLQLLLIEWLFYQLLVVALEDKIRRKWMFIWGCMCLQLFLLAGAVGGEAFSAHLITTGAAHLGTVILSLIAFLFLFRYLRYKRSLYLVLFAVVCVVSMVSDGLFIGQAMVPFFLFPSFSW